MASPPSGVDALMKPHSPSAPSFPPVPPVPPPLHLTIRFSNALPDLHLDVPSPASTTVASLKHQIRRRLVETAAQQDAVAGNTDVTRGRIRLVHGGRILPDKAALSAVLRALPPPPLAPAALSSAAKGKGVEGRAAPARVYVNCSVGDALTEEELADEARLAAAPALAADGPSAGCGIGVGSRARSTTASRTPRGFDRLLQGGFTTAEVNRLRLQFRSMQAARHTPDTMPSPNTLREMEDAWIDNNDNGGAGMAGGNGDGGMGEAGAGGDEAAMLDAVIKGMAVGFLFPLGTAGWLLRQQGLWSMRMRVWAMFGLVLSCTIGIIRALSGDR